MKNASTVKLTLDARKPPTLTAAQRKCLANLAAMPESKIDFSDIPRTRSTVKWSRPGALITTENKRQITLRLDAEVLTFFRSTGTRYQSRINAVLREYISAYRKVV